MIVGGCAFVPQRIALLGKQGPARSMCAPGLRVAAYPEMTIKDDSLHEQPNAVEKVRIGASFDPQPPLRPQSQQLAHCRQSS